MNVAFSKYHGTGNDFIIIDDWKSTIQPDSEWVAHICHRRFGVGADGLILVRKTPSADYEMVYYNADGRIGSMCGNGARCAFAFARLKHSIPDPAKFIAFDGPHLARSLANDWISVSMKDVEDIEPCEESGRSYVLDTGSPHYVEFVDDLDEIDVYTRGRDIRMLGTFREAGVNVNFVEIRKAALYTATYERGVEDVTLSCGTGVVAVALVHAKREGLKKGPVRVITRGGALTADFTCERDGHFQEITLQGPAEYVFDGEVRL